MTEPALLPQSILLHLSQLLGISQAALKAMIALLNEGGTVPFIARYRKQATGALDEVKIRGCALTSSTLILCTLSLTTPLLQLLTAYALFGVGLGMVNPAITNSAVAGMPLSQAGVAAAIASTGRQVGAALGVAVAGTVLKAGHVAARGFAQATHPVWGLMTLCGVVVVLVSWSSATTWAHNSAVAVASLLTE